MRHMISLEEEKINILLELLICPETGGKLCFDKKHNVFLSKKANLVFVVHHGIPDLILENEGKVFDENNLVFYEQEKVV